MSNYLITQETTDCIGCRACEVHCKAFKQTGPGIFLCRILEVYDPAEPVPRIAHVYFSCFHCEKAFCIAACPTGAMRRREQDGIVFVQQAACVGCKACITACPWTIPQWNSVSGRVEKCDLCMDRLDQGLAPACVTKCTTGCLQFTTPAESAHQTQLQLVRQLVRDGREGDEVGSY